MDKKQFKNSPNLLTLLRKLQAKCEKEPEFKAVIEHDKYGTNQNILMTFPLEKKDWETLENKLISNEDY